MRKQVGSIEIDTIAAERSKFTAPIVLVHGLWCTSSIWHRLMGYLAHRGWDCYAVNLRGRAARAKTTASAPPARAGIAEHLDDLNAVINACDAPPVVIGHDFGGLLALSKKLFAARAVVAISPLLPAHRREAPIPGLTDLRSRFRLRLRKRLSPPRGRARRAYFGAEPPRRLVSETRALADDLSNPTLSFAVGPPAPTLLVGGDADAVTPLDTVARTAADLGADFQLVSGGGHALPWEQGWQERAAEIHRWLVHTLGESLLAMLDEEDCD